VSWIFSPASPFATRAHCYRTESTLPRIAAAFAAGIGCAVAYGYLPAASSGSGSAGNRPASRAASVVKEPAAVSPKAEPVASHGQDHAADTNTGSLAAAGVARADQAERLSRPARADSETPPPPRPATLTPVPLPPTRPVLAGRPSETSEITPLEAPAPLAAGNLAASPTVEAPPPAKPVKRADSKRPAAKSRKPGPDLEDEGLHYVGTRVLPDGSRIPVYRRIERSRSLGYADSGPYYDRPRIRLFE
jgi:hypothetical protein